ncbi:hypothetical protein BCR41DRAFT_362294 [Lobosporangium transversale]|uniref:C2H2-type domain-containing protein n=1 Tax=Lobosporangium transversale TaxID=64571 RepID=A0A1Y2G9F1_9FUNG|nr:hypothetical protein BCR41DRAFT_362294 [Lobosporangium transversale]ORZ04823.1 hypothetical protein BCR41DRAFT_362294 [Lobosporangium transversale]|eukprot:XP_021876760.1 hypothetical protein BCR41DRAFT_362294 [Lobosporangium transversale]
MKAEPPTDLDHDRLMARYHSWGAREKRESPSESRDFDRGSLRQRLVNTDPTSTTTVNVRPSTVIKDTMSLSQTELRQESFEMNYVPSGHVLTNAFRTPLTDGEDFRYRDGVSHGMVRQDALIDRTKLRLVSPSDAHITHIDGLARREQYPPKHAVPPRLSADNVTTDLTSFTKADEGAEAVYREKVLGRQTWPSYLTPINVEPPAGRDAILPNHRAQAQKSAAIPTYTSSSSAPSPTLSSTSSLTNQQKSDDVTNVKPSTIPYNQEEDDVPCSISTPVASMATDPEISSSQFRSKLRVGQAGYYRQEDLQGLYREWAKTEDWMRRDPPTSLQHEGQLLYPRRDASRDGIVTKRGSHNGLYNLDSYQTSTNVNRSGVNKGKDEIRGLNNVVKAKQNSDRKGIRMSQNVKGKEKIRRLSLVVDDEVDYGGPTRLDHKVKEKDDYVNTSQCASELDSEDGSRLNYNSDFNEYGGLVKDGYSNKDNESDHSSDYSAEGIRGRASSDSNNPGGNVDRQIKGKERVDNFSQQFISAGLPVNKDGKAALGDGVRRRRRESKSHQCDVCQKRFSRPSQLRTHLFTHSGEKPHMCPLCHKLFNVASNLTRHVRTHGSTKRKSSRIGSIVFRSFGHGFQTKQAGNNNAATGETVSRTDGMMSRRASASASSQPPEKLRWMVAETPFSGSLAADRRTKVVKQQKKAEHELMSLYAKATLSSPKLGQQRPDPVSLAPVSVLDPITALVTTDNKVMSTASSATNAAVKTPNIMKMAVTSTLMTTTTAITTTTTVAAATSTALPSNEMSARNMNTDHSQIAT